MTNVFDYLKWRGDLIFEQSPFNEIDAMILAKLSYFPYEHIEGYITADNVTVADAAGYMQEIPNIKDKFLLKGDYRIMKVLAEAPRFKNLILSDYENLIDLDTQTQFFAITVKMNDNLHYVSFRGTDSTFVGWKEDLNMSFVCPVPAQEIALKYLEKVAKNHHGNFVVGGHSKGGNLAVYSSAFCDAELQDRIDVIYNFDGPGFSKQVLSALGYQRIAPKIKTFVPQSSVVGLMLEHQEEYTIVHSSQPVTLFQHDLFSWSVKRTRFEYLETVTNSSKFIDSTLKNWIDQMSVEDREKFFDAIYMVFTETKLQDFKEFGDNWFASAKAVVKSIKSVDEPTRKMMTETFRSLVKCAAKTAKGKNKKARE